MLVPIHGELRYGEFIGYVNGSGDSEAEVRLDGLPAVERVPVFALRAVKLAAERWWWPGNLAIRWTIVGIVVGAVGAVATVLSVVGVGGQHITIPRGATQRALGQLTPARSPGGFAPSGRTTFRCITPTDCAGADYVAFNSFTNAPNYGDERAFFDAKDVQIKASGYFRDRVVVHDGDHILLRVYVHNNANPSAIGLQAATARNTTLLIRLPESVSSDSIAAAQISASNAEPRLVSDTIHLTSSEPFTVSFDRSQPVLITYRANGHGSFITRTLVSAAFANDFTLNAKIGDWQGCFNYSALITMVAQIHV